MSENNNENYITQEEANERIRKFAMHTIETVEKNSLIAPVALKLLSALERSMQKMVEPPPPTYQQLQAMVAVLRSNLAIEQDKQSALEAKCAALAAELKQSQIDAACYKKGMEASNERLVQVAAENAGLKAKGRELLDEACKVYEKFNTTINPETGDLMDGQTLHEFQFLLDADTPSTDAFLAEVRAQGADECVRQLVISDDDDFSDAPNVCAMVAHQLRQEASK